MRDRALGLVVVAIDLRERLVDRRAQLCEPALVELERLPPAVAAVDELLDGPAVGDPPADGVPLPLVDVLEQHLRPRRHEPILCPGDLFRPQSFGRH